LCDIIISGILKAVHGTQSYDHNRVTKDVVAFYAGDFPDLVEKLQLDLHEPPISQVKIYIILWTCVTYLFLCLR
jgi:hypothetical protein